jgi:structural maintenance of chromosome 3 (chondroitin sulfate proteoglycan 6)
MTVGNFSPMSNCLFGMNGSGKSTFIQGIEFVLLDDFAHIRPSERQALLFSGPTTASTAFVEIIFDNSDHSFPGLQSEVSVRRSIGINKDEYFIDRKHISRAELRDLLETAGLASRLFVVRQGHVKSVAEMNDERRLQLLYEVSGIDSYNEKREQSLKMMGEANQRREKIDQALAEIQKRLGELEAETAELAEYEVYDNRRKALEFLVYDQERSRAVDEILRTEEEIGKESSVVELMRKKLSDQKAAMRDLEGEHRQKIKERDQVMKVLGEAEAKREALVQKRVRLEFRIADLTKKMEDSEMARAETQALVDEFVRQRSVKVAAITELAAHCEDLRSRKTQMEATFEDPNALGDCQHEISVLKDQLSSLELEVSATSTRLETLENTDKRLLSDSEELTRRLGACATNLASLKERRLSLLDQQKRLWKEEHRLKMHQTSSIDALRNAERKMTHLRGAAVSSALTFLESRQFPLTFKLFIDHITFDAALDLAVDAVAKARLFHLIVENERVAEEIINILQREKGGRLGMFALNCVRARGPVIARTASVSPLVEELEFDERVRPVVESVFGGVALCSTLEIAAQTAAALGATCVTLSGDLVLANGPMIGGADEATAARRSPCKTKRWIQRLADEREQIDAELAAVAGELAATEKELKAISAEIVGVSSASLQAEAVIGSNEAERKGLHNDIAQTEHALAGLRKKGALIEKALRSAYEREIALNRKLLRTDGDIVFSREQYRAVSAEFAAAMLRLEAQKSELENCVIPEIRRLEAKLEALEPRKITHRLEQARLKCDHHSHRIDHFETDLRESADREVVLTGEIEATERAITRERDKLSSLEWELANQQRCVSEYNKALLLQTAKRDELVKKLGAIGPYPATEVGERSGLSHSELMREMKATNRELERFRFVNKRAFDQFRQFRDQRQELERRQAEINESEASIVALIRQLDEKKKESMCACFSKVSERFRNIYSVFRPEVRATIVLKQHGDYVAELDPEKVTGIGIVVEDQPMEALSGGQRTLIALSLIFALQQSEPNPFYLLDEIDADLDVAHTDRLARFIQTLTGDDDDPESCTQVIYTSHRNEMIAAAKKYYAVYTKHGAVSTIREVGFDEVAGYLEGEKTANDDNERLPITM